MSSRWRQLVVVSALLLSAILFLRLPFQLGIVSPLDPGPKSDSAVPSPVSDDSLSAESEPVDHPDGAFDWAGVPQRYPVESLASLPSPRPRSIPKIQATFVQESAPERQSRLMRLSAVKTNFTHAWEGYKKHAWLRDEVKPLSGEAQDPFGGWAATLVDSLDTLWIMDLHDEFKEAVSAVESIDFTTCSLGELNVFETTIRYLGGFLSAYDLSDGQFPVLLSKAKEMGNMLYKAFDTPNRLPVTRWDFRAAIEGVQQEAQESTLVAEIGSLTLEWTRLSQLTGDTRYYDAIALIMDIFEAQQAQTKLPGLFPVLVNAKNANFTQDSGFTIGGMADSLYEYFGKQHQLLGGGTEQYRKLYQNAMVALQRNIFYRPMTADKRDLLVPGQTRSDGTMRAEDLKTEPQAQHLGCFAGGMVALGSKLFQNGAEMEIAKQLVEGCLWGYEVAPLGVMPEIIHTVPCPSVGPCGWDEQRWKSAVQESYGGPEDVRTKITEHHLPKGFTEVNDKRYILRPEAIESIFVLYRLTGDASLRDRAWTMFNSIVSLTRTSIAHAALDDCTIENPPKSDRMESFWTAETLKYFYLLYSEPDLVSMDEYVFNTEAHPLKRPR
ncbi:glycoside hydrolase family 47 protein [Viridothelium virens]|uniref:alpha-1,2-Mannosidase n=1 Tax=Viridothelium virens TaxID=1048519 RepID=A0A6A6H2Z2_VIRVR|nr:glycoside hydrolase family 47 protein [Viridothelium virens]